MDVSTWMQSCTRGACPECAEAMHALSAIGDVARSRGQRERIAIASDQSPARILSLVAHRDVGNLCPASSETT